MTAHLLNHTISIEKTETGAINGLYVKASGSTAAKIRLCHFLSHITHHRPLRGGAACITITNQTISQLIRF
ncbi:MAG: hypothetical protein K1V89_09635 [Muribaculaceae bacterium]